MFAVFLLGPISMHGQTNMSSITPDDEVYIGDTVLFEVPSYIGDIQWQFSTDEIDWIGLSSSNPNELEYIISETGFFRAKFTYNNCEYFSDTAFIEAQDPLQASEYVVTRLNDTLTIDANWEKPQWQSVRGLEIKNIMGDVPSFIPTTHVKMLYDNDNLYVIFHVEDRYVRIVTNTINGPVWNDACVEFFFSPDTLYPLWYFNLEVTGGGTPLMHYNLIPFTDVTKLDTLDIATIEIAHSLPEIVDPEIKDSITWTLEYSLPLDLLKKYSNLTVPKQGVKWRANFYKTATTNSNPHYITWNFVDNPKPNFHLPEFFGTIVFE